jgi:nicotinate-nucleotide adenylyltransferase
VIRLGLFGGTFDPVHYGHLKPLESARLELNLDQSLLLPNPHPPHKQHLDIAPYLHRKHMLELALNEFPEFEIADYEEEVVGTAYTSDTVRRIVTCLPKDTYEIWLIIGADSLIEFPSWRNPEEIFSLAKIAVLPRPGVDLDQAPPLYRSRVRELHAPLLDISATRIRELLQAGETPSDLLPIAVIDYIRANGLYGIIK